MLNNILNLTKVFLKSGLNQGSNTNKKKNNFLKYILYAFLLIYLFGAIGLFSYFLVDTLLSINQENVFVGYVLTAIIFFTLFTIILSGINIYYFSNDNLSILPLPVKPLEVLASKMNTLLVYAYFESFLLGLPSLIIFGVKTHQDFFYYLLMLIILLVLPIVPLVLGSLLIMILMSFTKGIKNKNIVQIITMSLSIIFGLSVSIISSTTSTEEDTLLLITKANGLTEIVKKYFFTIGLGIDTLIDKNLISLILLILLSVALYILVVLFGQKLYYRGMLGSLFSSSGITNKKLDETKAFKSNGLFTSYVLKELRTYIRKPIYLIQLVFPCIILPIFMIIMFYFGMSKGLGDELKPVLDNIYMNDEFNRIIFTIALLLIFFNTMYSFISTVAISKDGKDAAFMKYIPVPFSNQIIYKMIPDIVLVLINYILVIIMGRLLINLPLKFILLSALVIIPFSFVHGALIIVDIRKPKLTWTNEMQVVKNNLRMFYSLVLDFIFMGLLALLGFYFKLDMILIALIMSLVFCFLSIVFIILIYKKDIKLASNIY